MPCPEPSRLAALALGTLAEPDLPALAEHVDRCAACEGKLRALEAADPLLAGVREGVAEVPPGFLGRLSRARVGATLGRFELLDELGAGSFAQVYRARDRELGRVVALKVPRPGALDDAERFLREARAVARLQHPGIVALHEIGQADDGTCFLVEEFIAGVTLERRLRDGPIEPRDAAELLSRVARALHHAHEHGVVHRDVKPANVLLSSDTTYTSYTTYKSYQPKVTDFGLAKRDAEEPPLTLEGQVLGTPAYMSPEQARGDSRLVDARSDVYSLGVILYELLTGERPFRGTRRMLLLQVLEDDPRPPRRLNDKAPRDLEVVCLKCLEKSPAKRYSSASALADDLDRWLAGEPIRARPLGVARRLVRWGRRHPLTASLFLAVTLGSAIGLWHLSRLSRELVRSAALESASQHTEILEVVNNRFTSEVVQRAWARGVPVRPDYLREKGALPLPATFTIDIGHHLSQQSESGMRVRLYSDYPWPWRTDGGPRDDFERDALTQLRERPAEPYFRFEDLDGKPVLRYAVARRMSKDCLACHNHLAESPRKDWREGDVRGVLEIIRPLQGDAERTRKGLRGTFLLMAGVSGLLLGVGALLVALGRRRA